MTNNSEEEKDRQSLEEAEADSSPEYEVYIKLREAEVEARSTNQRYSHKEVMSELLEQLTEKYRLI